MEIEPKELDLTKDKNGRTKYERFVSEIEKIESHSNEAVGRAIPPWRFKPNFQQFLSGLVSPIQDLEQAAFDLLEFLNLETAEGIWLDLLGLIVGEQRKGKTDESFRNFIKIRILANRSTGKHEEILKILRLLAPLDPPQIYALFISPGSILYELITESLEISYKELAEILSRIKMGGVALYLVHSRNEFSHNEAFRFSHAVPVADLQTGLSSVSEYPLGGGLLASVVRV